MGAVYWPVLVLILLFGGIALSVQTLVAHAYGARRYTRASQATWTALWGALLTLPLFAVLAVNGRALFSPFGLPAGTLDLAMAYWLPRMLGAPLGIALYAMLGFFNGIGRPTITLRVTSWWRSRMHCSTSCSYSDSASASPARPGLPAPRSFAGVAMAFVWFFSPAKPPPLPLASDEPVRARAAAQADRPGVSHGASGGGRHSRIRAFSAHAGAARQRRRGVDADRAHADLVLLHARRGHRHGGNHARGTGDRRKEAGLGAHRGQRNHPSRGSLHGTWWGWACGHRAVVSSVVHQRRRIRKVCKRGERRQPYCLWIAAGYQLFDGLNISSSACLRGAGDVRLPCAHGARVCRGRCSCRWRMLCRSSRRRVGRLAAAIRARCRRRLARRTRLYLLPRARCCSCAGARARGGAWCCDDARTQPPSRAGFLSACSVGHAARGAALGPRTTVRASAIATRSASRRHGHVSYLVLDVESGQIAASLNPGTPRSPASTIKVVTTFAALDSLGPAYTWHTQALLAAARSRTARFGAI